MRGLKNFETAIDFTDGWLVYYNYLRPHESLEDKTPAEVAGIAYPYKNWSDITRKHTPSVKIILEHQPRVHLKVLETHIGRPRLGQGQPKPKITKVRRLPKEGIFVGKGMMSRHYFKGAKRIRRIG
jgi:hypothetical protein